MNEPKRLRYGTATRPLARVQKSDTISVYSPVIAARKKDRLCGFFNCTNELRKGDTQYKSDNRDNHIICEYHAGWIMSRYSFLEIAKPNETVLAYRDEFDKQIKTLIYPQGVPLHEIMDMVE